MHILITGANGFIGRHLIHSLLQAQEDTDSPFHNCSITAIDQRDDLVPAHPQVNTLIGSFADPALIAQATRQDVDLAFHLAAVPSGLCEQNPELGMSVNVHGTLQLLDALRTQKTQAKLVFASSIAVYGKPAVPCLTDDTAPSPGLSYGAHKIIGEALVHDYARRGWIRGCALRLPGIVARPPEPNGAVSIFLSDLIRELAAGKHYTCPTSAAACTWLMSVQTCVDNLIHAASQPFADRHIYMLPALYVPLGELVQAIGRVTGATDIQSRIHWAADPWVEANFGSYPPVSLPKAQALGFVADASVDELVRSSLASAAQG